MKPDESVALVSTFFENPENARAGLAAGAALHEAGEHELAVALWTLADDANGRVRRIKDLDQAPPFWRNLSALADRELRRFLTALHARAIDEFETSTATTVDRVRSSVWPLTHASAVRQDVPMQRSLIFHMPDLPAHPIEPNARFAWVPALEAATGSIKAEYEAYVGIGGSAQPYVPAGTNATGWASLSGSLDWSAIHLCQNAKRMPVADSFSETLRALEAVDLVRIDGVPMEIFFSRLKAGAHIPPHHGLTNTRVTVHLPLVVPDGCMIRVARHQHHWREGRVLAFDDSFEHEAWNRSESDRTVLIFEAHHPDLAVHERAAIEHAYAVRQRWLDARREKLDAWLRKSGDSAVAAAT